MRIDPFRANEVARYHICYHIWRLLVTGPWRSAAPLPAVAQSHHIKIMGAVRQ